MRTAYLTCTTVAIMHGPAPCVRYSPVRMRVDKESVLPSAAEATGVYFCARGEDVEVADGAGEEVGVATAVRDRSLAAETEVVVPVGVRAVAVVRLG